MLYCLLQSLEMEWSICKIWVIETFHLGHKIMVIFVPCKIILYMSQYYMGLYVAKPVFAVSDKARLEPVSSAT